MKLICLTGIDGAGKTTLACSLVAALKSRGIESAYVYGRTYPVISRWLMALGRGIFLRKHDPWRDYRIYNAEKKRVMHNRLLISVYTGAIWFDYFVQIWLKLFPYLVRRQVVVLDRYIYDTVISDLAVHLSYTPHQTERAIKRGLRFLPVPLLTTLIDLPEEVAMARKDDVPHIEYLQERRERYLGLGVRTEVELADGQEPSDILLEGILNRARALLGKPL